MLGYVGFLQPSCLRKSSIGEDLSVLIDPHHTITEIRLRRLFPSSEDEFSRCKILVTFLPSRTSYEALSHNGGRGKQHSIDCDRVRPLSKKTSYMPCEDSEREFMTKRHESM